MDDLGDESGAGKSFFDVIALQVDVRINFVRDAVVTLIALETNIVSRRADPQRFAVHGERRFPEAKVIARSDDADGFGVRPAVILRPAEKIKLAHRHREVRLFREADN